MSRKADTIVQLGRLQRGMTPPLISNAFAGDTKLIRRWTNEPFEYDFLSLTDHVISAKYSGQGTDVARIDGRTMAGLSRAGTVTIGVSGHGGYWRLGGRVEVSNVILGRKRLMAVADQIGNGREPALIDRVNQEDPKLFTLLSMINDEVSDADAMSHLYIEQLLDVLCLQLIRAHSDGTMTLAVGPGRGLSSAQVRRVTTYMRDNLAQHIQVQELAELVNLSRFHFTTAFRMATGTTPYEWLMRQRIENGKALLKNSSLRIGDIALIVGYDTQSAFAASFRKITGMSPTDFRRRL